MEKAYDVKALAEKLKELGLPVLEDTALKVVDATFTWVEESAVMSENKYDDFALALTPVLKKFVKDQVEKIDKTDNA